MYDFNAGRHSCARFSLCVRIALKRWQEGCEYRLVNGVQAPRDTGLRGLCPRMSDLCRNCFASFSSLKNKQTKRVLRKSSSKIRMGRKKQTNKEQTKKQNTNAGKWRLELQEKEQEGMQGQCHQGSWAIVCDSNNLVKLLLAWLCAPEDNRPRQQEK